MSLASVLTGTPATTTLVNNLTLSTRSSYGDPTNKAIPANATAVEEIGSYIVAAGSSNLPINGWALVTVLSDTASPSGSLFMSCLVYCYPAPAGQPVPGTPYLDVFDQYSSIGQYVFNIGGSNTLYIGNLGTAGGGSGTAYVDRLSVVVQPLQNVPPLPQS